MAGSSHCTPGRRVCPGWTVGLEVQFEQLLYARPYAWSSSMEEPNGICVNKGGHGIDHTEQRH